MAEHQDVCERKSAAPAAAPGRAAPHIRPVEPEDGPAVHHLLTSCLSDVLPDRDTWLARWRWQCWDNPFRQGRPAGYVLAEGRRVLGHLGAVSVPLHVGDVPVTGVIGADYAVCDEGLSKSGVFAALELAQRLFSDCRDCLVMATTANDKTGAVFGRFGCRPVEWTREFWRASTGLHQQIRTCCGGKSRLLRRAMNSRLGPLVKRTLAVGWRAASDLPHIPIRRGCWLETTVPQLAGDLGHLWEVAREAESNSAQAAWNPSKGLAVSRSQEFLDWRYTRHPQRDHIRVLVVRSSRGKPLGAAIVFRDQRTDRHVLYVEDLLVLPERPDVVRTLLCAALRLACQVGAEHLVTSPGRRSHRDMYWELGFESRARNAPAVLVGTLQSAEENAAIPEPAHDHLEFWHGMMF